MNNERRDLLSLATLPARLSSEETANFLGFKAHDMPILMKAGLIKPLGRPNPNGDKYFATVALLELRQDVQWLSRATAAVSQHWKHKNANKPEGRKSAQGALLGITLAKGERSGVLAHS